jgi:hypothetical protein
MSARVIGRGIIGEVPMASRFFGVELATSPNLESFSSWPTGASVPS